MACQLEMMELCEQRFQLSNSPSTTDIHGPSWSFWLRTDGLAGRE